VTCFSKFLLQLFFLCESAALFSAHSHRGLLGRSHAFRTVFTAGRRWIEARSAICQLSIFWGCCGTQARKNHSRNDYFYCSRVLVCDHGRE